MNIDEHSRSQGLSWLVMIHRDSWSYWKDKLQSSPRSNCKVRFTHPKVKTEVEIGMQFKRIEKKQASVISVDICYEEVIFKSVVAKLTTKNWTIWDQPVTHREKTTTRPKTAWCERYGRWSPEMCDHTKHRKLATIMIDVYICLYMSRYIYICLYIYNCT